MMVLHSIRIRVVVGVVVGVLALIAIIFSIPLWTLSAEETETYTEIETKTEYRKEPYSVMETYEVRRTTHSETLYKTPVTIYPGQWWLIFMWVNGNKIGVYESDLKMMGNKPLATVEHKPQSRMILQWSPLGVNKAKVHGLVIDSEKLKITDELRKDPNRLHFHIIDSATWHEFAASGNLAFSPKEIQYCALMHAEPSGGGTSPNTVSMNFIYEWDEIEEGSRKVLKYREVPVEVPVTVEKQRTVTSQEKVSFWKVLFSLES